MNVSFTARDSGGGLVDNLQKEDVDILEDGVEQTGVDLPDAKAASGDEESTDPDELRALLRNWRFNRGAQVAPRSFAIQPVRGPKVAM